MNSSARTADATGAVVFASIVTLALSVALLWVIPTPGPLDLLPDPPSGPDRVPAGPLVRAVPAGCALSPATLERLVDGPRLVKDGARGVCAWASRGGDERSGRYLSIAVDLSPDTSATAYPYLLATGRAPLSAAMKSFGPRWSGVTGQAVTGLGDEALLQVSPSNGATVVARVGNARAVVQYTATRLPMPEAAARDGAFTAAAEVVAGLGARGPVRPAVAAPARPAPARTIPDLCAALPERTLRDLVAGDGAAGGSESAQTGLAVEGARQRGCTWRSPDRDLRVAVAVVPGAGPFDGVRSAAREYAIRHIDARAEEPLSVRDRKYFHPVPGLGDEAFAVHVPGVVPGTVLFRDGDALALVTYAESDERRPLSGGEALRGAYAAAREIARALSAEHS
ncbi:hypothetical protein [Actinomadura chibensis]|uniref:DUF3558 domain-containing protein n=1 Tax=Actinomadura chibensis TaxID=392828 RepID=A0A5D0NUF1_9ACTN|nr:hypothetical protein [Actinomadura chibensis]TYB48136.1 hypothetical protein FXF69_02620 [Actinomadura chibensis]